MVTSFEHVAGAIGPLRDKQLIDISSDDFVDVRGFILQAAAAGDIQYTTLAGTTAVETVTEGAVISVGSYAVLCRSVNAANSTIDSVVIGYL